MPMPKTIGELKQLLDNVPDDTPLQFTMQGIPHWDWSMYHLDEEATADGQEEFPAPTFVVSVDL